MAEAARSGEAGCTLRFEVQGMTCASCAARVERVLARQPGVRRASVSFASGEATVETEPQAADAQRLAEAIERIGYRLVPIRAEETRERPDERLAREARAQAKRFATAAALSAPVLLLAFAATGAAWSRLLQALLATPVVLVAGAQFHRAAWVRARSLDASMDTLVSLGTLAAYLYSLGALVAGQPVFFDTAAVIVTLILLGRTFEARAKGRASSAVTRLLELGAHEARRLENGQERAVPVEALRPGDRVVIRPGEKVPSDAVIEEGESVFDESMLTGESMPVERGPGDPIYGATLNGPGRVVARITRVGSETALAQIVRLVEQAQSSKAPVQKLADRIAGVFVPAVLAIAVATAVGWVLAGADAPTALRNAVAVLIIACPCALGLATPTAIMVGSGRGAELGVLFKGADVFERSRGIDTVVFDKTGTLTQGEMTLTDAIGVLPDREWLPPVAAVEQASEHPVGRAVARGVEARGLALPRAEAFRSVAGRGVEGRVAGRRVQVGRTGWLRELGVEVPERLAREAERLEAAGRTTFAAALDGRAVGVLAVADEPRPGAARAIAELRRLGVGVAMLTGDNRRTAEAMAARLGVSEVMAEVLPGEKARAIEALQRRGRRVAFVGDGINDAPALTQADLGIAVGSGSDVAIEAGDVVLLSGDPALVPLALRLARRTFRTIAQNLFWAFFYNAAAIPLAASGRLDPMIAAAAMAFSSVTVVTNSLRLRRFAAHERERERVPSGHPTPARAQEVRA